MRHTFFAPNDYRSYLEHYGVKGMKWGVRKDNKVYSRDREKANDIYNTLTEKEKHYVAAEDTPPKEYVTKEEYAPGGYNVFSFIEQYKDTPVSVLDLWDQDDGSVAASIAVRNDPKFRGKGYAKRAVEAGQQWLESHPEYSHMSWGVAATNEPSKNLAKSHGFHLQSTSRDFFDPDNLDKTWEYYIYKNPKSKW